MQLVYYSMTNNTKRFVDKLTTDLEIVDINSYNHQEYFILITPTYNFGQIPDEVAEFLNGYGQNMCGVISSGNKNWGKAYGQAGNKISGMYDVPLLHKFEMMGSKKDVEIVNNIIKKYI